MPKRGNLQQEIARLSARIRASSEPDSNGHLIWKGCVNNKGIPIMSFAGRAYTVPRLVLIARKKAFLPPDRYATQTCGIKRCVSDSCIKEVSKSEYLTAANIRDPSIQHRRTAGIRRKAAKLNLRKALEIRARFLAGESPTQLAREFAVGRSTVYLIGRNKSWTSKSISTWHPC